MTKSDLHEKWSKYCNTDELVDSTMALLSKYDHDNSEHGVCVLLDNYFTSKEPLIKLMANSKNYIGDMRIATIHEFDRAIDRDEVYGAVNSIANRINYSNFFKYTDDKGKTLDNYLVTGQTSYTIDNMPSEDVQESKLREMRNFDYDNLATKESCKNCSDFSDYMEYFRYINYSQIQKDYNNENKPVTFKAGTKTSRAFNKVCHYYGVDKFDPQTTTTEKDGVTVTKTIYPYDKLFAAYADVVSDLVRKMHFVISVNPLDYLTMSSGVNWKSCHNIASGGWKGGCLSYMLDNSSIITYVVTELNAPIHENLKVYRQMFHYNNGLFMQSRLYPQGNDGATNLYDKFRGFVVDEFKDILNTGEEWEVEVGTRPCKDHVKTYGVHYPDYTHNNSCAIFYPKTKSTSIREHVMNVGHEGICVRCGKPYQCSNRFTHESTRDCVI